MTSSTVQRISTNGTIAHGVLGSARRMSDSLLGAIIGMAGALAAFMMRLIVGKAMVETKLMMAEMKEQVDREFRSLEHRLTMLEAVLSDKSRNASAD